MFVDLKKVYDRVNRENMWNILELNRFGGKMIKAVKIFHNESKAYVRLGNESRE